MHPLRRLFHSTLVFVLVIVLGFVCHSAYAQNNNNVTYARPYTGGGPTPYSVTGPYGNALPAVYLVDPVTGNPITPAGTPTGGGSSNPAGLTNNGSVGTTSTTIAAAGTYPHWFTIQNTSINGNTLYVRLDGAAATGTAFPIAPGGALTVPSGLSTAVTAVGSAATTLYTIVGY
jgi:hypothetical protein